MLQSSYHDFAIACNTGYQTTTPLFQLTTLFATFSSLVVKMLLWQPKHANYKSLIIKFFKIELNIEVVGFELKILLPTKILFDRLINIYLSFFYDKDPRKKIQKFKSIWTENKKKVNSRYMKDDSWRPSLLSSLFLKNFTLFLATFQPWAKGLWFSQPFCGVWYK